MRRYRSDTGTPIRTDYGIGLVAGLQAYPETAPLAPPFEQLNEDLDAAHAERRARRKPLVKARACLRLANCQVDQTLRMVHAAAQIADGGRKGLVTSELFPDGLAAAISPKGAKQIKPTEAVVDKFAKSKLPGVTALGAEWLPRLQPALAALCAAADATSTAYAAFTEAFQMERALRDEHARQVDRLMGLVRAAFPADKARQDAVFPEVDTGSETAGLEDGDAEPVEPVEPVDAPPASASPA